MDITKLQSLLTIKDDATLVIIKLGWQTIARIENEDGAWYPEVKNTDGKWIHINGMNDSMTKEEAFNKIIQRFQE